MQMPVPKAPWSAAARGRLCLCSWSFSCLLSQSGVESLNWRTVQGASRSVLPEWVARSDRGGSRTAPTEAWHLPAGRSPSAGVSLKPDTCSSSATGEKTARPREVGASLALIFGGERPSKQAGGAVNSATFLGEIVNPIEKGLQRPASWRYNRRTRSAAGGEAWFVLPFLL